MIFTAFILSQVLINSKSSESIQFLSTRKDFSSLLRRLSFLSPLEYLFPSALNGSLTDVFLNGYICFNTIRQNFNKALSNKEGSDKKSLCSWEECAANLHHVPPTRKTRGLRQSQCVPHCSEGPLYLPLPKGISEPALQQPGCLQCRVLPHEMVSEPPRCFLDIARSLRQVISAHLFRSPPIAFFLCFEWC